MADHEFPEPDELRMDARRDFAEFYRQASTADAMLMDGLVMAVATLTVGYNALSAETDAATRTQLERMTVQAEAEFIHLRDEVRECPTFRRVSPGMQLLIERTLFEVKVPEA